MPPQQVQARNERVKTVPRCLPDSPHYLAFEQTFAAFCQVKTVAYASVTAGRAVVSLPGFGVVSCGEPPAQEEVLAVRLFEGLAQGGGFLVVAAPEVGELGGQRAHDA